MRYLMGLDIGYSNLKQTMGILEEGFEGIKTLVRPVGAAPVVNCLEGGLDMTDQRVPVQIDNQDWYACVEPSMIIRDERSLNYDYLKTKQYEAVMTAALMASEQDVIDVLVTGLPVSQAKDPQIVAALVERMKGKHQVGAERVVEVKEVLVRPQPNAAFIRMMQDHREDRDMLTIIRTGTTVVVDPGFFSVDWVTMKNGAILRESSGTSIRAMYRIIVAAAEDIIRAFGGGASVRADIEKALRLGEKSVLANGKFVELEPYLEKAAAAVAPVALSEMKQDMALRDNSADVLVLTGGGGRLYEPTARSILSDCRHILTFASPVTAIAEGYWLTAAGYAATDRSVA